MVIPLLKHQRCHHHISNNWWDFRLVETPRLPPFSKLLPDLGPVENDNWMAAIEHDRPNETMQITSGFCVVNRLLELACDLYTLITPSNVQSLRGGYADMPACYPTPV